MYVARLKRGAGACSALLCSTVDCWVQPDIAQTSEDAMPGSRTPRSPKTAAPPCRRAPLTPPPWPVIQPLAAAHQGAGQCTRQRHLDDQPHHAAQVAGAAWLLWGSCRAAAACLLHCSVLPALGWVRKHGKQLAGWQRWSSCHCWQLCSPTLDGDWLPQLLALQHAVAAAAHSPLLPGHCRRCIATLQVAQTQAMLANEYGTASNIKSRVNRQSVLGAITSAQQRLKLYTRVQQGRGVVVVVVCGWFEVAVAMPALSAWVRSAAPLTLLHLSQLVH